MLCLGNFGSSPFSCRIMLGPIPMSENSAKPMMNTLTKAIIPNSSGKRSRVRIRLLTQPQYVAEAKASHGPEGADDRLLFQRANVDQRPHFWLTSLREVEWFMRSISAIVRKPSEVSLSHFVCAKDESRQVPQGFTIHMHKP